MARRSNTAEAEVETPDVDVEDTEVETVDGSDTQQGSDKPAKAKKEPARGDLPEGYVTPIGLAKVLTERQLHKDRDGNVVEVRPQMVYSYMKNAPKDHPFPIETIEDSLGKPRQALKLDAGLAWWEEKNSRVAERKQNAATKAQAKAERAASKATSTEEADTAPDAAVVEAE